MEKGALKPQDAVLQQRPISPDWRVVGEMARATTAVQIEPVQLSADWRVVGGGSEMTKGAA